MSIKLSCWDTILPKNYLGLYSSIIQLILFKNRQNYQIYQILDNPIYMQLCFVRKSVLTFIKIHTSINLSKLNPFTVNTI
jgi:hypothetical protein